MKPDKWTGYLRLGVIKKDKKTIATDLYYYGAFKLMSPFYLNDDAEACYYIMNPGGGYVNGDRYRMEINIEKEAQLLLTTQSATKIYKSQSLPITQEVNITLKDGSLLEYLPDPIIAYQNSSFKQQTIINMDKKSYLIITDTITPGWDLTGGKFSYNLLELKTSIYLDNKLVLFDNIRLMPDNQRLSGIGLLEGFTHLGTMQVIGEPANEEFCLKLQELLESQNLNCNWGLSILSVPGFSLRILGFTTQEIEKVYNLCHNIIRKEWFKKPPLFLYKY